MKKQWIWIIIVAMAAILLAAVIIASRSFPDVKVRNNTETSQTTDTETPTGENEESTGENEESAGENDESTFYTISFEEYNNLEGPDREAYRLQFPSNEAFLAWHDEAKAEYDASRAAIETIDGNGSINLEDQIDKTKN